MCRILPLVECGVNNAPSEDEPPRASLIREIYAFLDCYVSFTTTSISSKLSVPLFSLVDDGKQINCFILFSLSFENFLCETFVVENSMC